MRCSAGPRPQRGYLGVMFQPIDDDSIAQALGVPKNGGELIRSVTPGGPADRAGIQQGDVIVAINGQNLTEDDRLAYVVSNLAVGTRVPIEIIRNGQRRDDDGHGWRAADRRGSGQDERQSRPPAPVRPPWIAAVGRPAQHAPEPRHHGPVADAGDCALDRTSPMPP